jgi:carbamoyltransferase
MSQSSTWVLGLGGSSHDYSAALCADLDVRVAIEGERLSRVKHGRPHFFDDPVRPAVAYCLASEGQEIAGLDRVVSGSYFPQRTIRDWSVTTYDHHLCHAASAVMMLPADTRACVIVFDGAGSQQGPPQEDGAAAFQTFSFFDFADCRLTPIGQTSGTGFVETLPVLDGCSNSLGHFYELITALIGFDRMEVGKTMGLAAWGRPRYLERFMEHVTLSRDLTGVFAFDEYDDELLRFVRRELAASSGAFQVRADLAATAQELFTRTVLWCHELVAEREFDVLCLAGGCALNTVANGRVAKALRPGRTLRVPPHSGDAGIALGSLWLDARERQSGPFAMTFRGQPVHPAVARPGRTYARSEVLAAVTAGLAGAAEDASVTTPEDLAALLATGAVIGVFNGPSEIGPRALGGRSLFAHPGESETRERINRSIKQREAFRPLAPIVLGEHFDAYFAPAAAHDPFMLVVAEATELCRRAAPAVVHIDGSARVQVIDEDADPFLRRLLTAFHALTGLPVLLNTSFNRRGEPIVETPAEAVSAFLSLGLDGLWLDGRFIRPTAAASPARL